jgi:eukaryotic-like serine/threonine-protein kinase
MYGAPHSIEGGELRSFLLGSEYRQAKDVVAGTGTNSPMTDAIGPLRAALAGHYEIQREIGQGAFATVYLARDLRHDRSVAFKVLNADPNSETGELRFLREIRLLAKLQHPNILPLIDSGHVEAMLYYVMPYVTGESLRQRIHRQGQLPFEAAISIAHDSADALAYAHDQGVVHRDIKPENILLSAGHPIIADFGVARAIDIAGVRQLTRTGLGSPGTPAYMSPEQLMGDKEVDRRTDIYSLGCVLYEMLTGQAPFPGKDGFVKRFTENAPLPSAIRKNLPDAADSIIAKALARDPEDRYSSAQDFATALARVQQQPSPPTFAQPVLTALEKGSRRQRSEKLGVIAGLTLMTVLALLASSSIYRRSQRGQAGSQVESANIPSLAVLPFENLGSRDDAYFAEGMTDEISSRLGSLAGLRVIGRQSAKSYANTTKSPEQIARELGVVYLLTGTVRWDRSSAGHNLVKISPQLLRASDGVQVWSERYQDEVKGVFDIQAKVAEHVAEALSIKLSQSDKQTLSSRPTNQPDAYDYFLRGKKLGADSFRASDFLRGVALLERAVQLDPRFALAYASLGIAHLNVYWFHGDNSQQHLQAAEAAIDTALAIDPKLAAGYIAKASYYYRGKLDYPKALEALEVAQGLSPNDPEALDLKGVIERRQNRWADAITDAEHATRLDPRNTSFLLNLCQTLEVTRNYDAAEKECGRAIAIAPDKWLGYSLLYYVPLMKSGDVNASLAILRSAQRLVDPAEFRDGLVSVGWPSYLDANLLSEMNAADLPEEQQNQLDYYFFKLTLSVYTKDTLARVRYADSMLAVVPRVVRGNILESDVHAYLSLAYAAKGDARRSLEQGRLSMQKTPFASDAMRAALNLETIARSEVLAGAYDQALSDLAQLLARPSFISIDVLRVDPWFDPIRHDRRFRQLPAAH